MSAPLLATTIIQFEYLFSNIYYVPIAPLFCPGPVDKTASLSYGLVKPSGQLVDVFSVGELEEQLDDLWDHSMILSVEVQGGRTTAGVRRMIYPSALIRPSGWMTVLMRTLKNLRHPFLRQRSGMVLWEVPKCQMEFSQFKISYKLATSFMVPKAA